MKANELMVGDYLMYNGFPYRVIQVDGIVRDGWMIENGEEDCGDPIPITPEILEKNGFIKDADKDDRLADVYHLLVPNGFERDSFTIQVSLYREPICGVSTLVKCWGWLPPYNGGINDIHLCSANYVHQLQHALRLCGIEKGIEL